MLPLILDIVAILVLIGVFLLLVYLWGAIEPYECEEERENE